ncbi:SGNH/GDSL hydrolase family protein [Mycolicibacter terrae]|uniref:SGNH/GDSL hydrolase family protein n=1 Tax=Mycolicibacter terrae TaxID=1788 RepID=A0ACD2EIZ5_9MYCO|nr:SGNH/GDSL hydrolase family protein [Mycolicibacter terrae]RRR41916.1 SGNH/GDSL hydrolase family protein [Mycolicibacter terrae]
MGIRVARRSAITLATAGALASSGTLYLGVRNLLAGQADLARQTIPRACQIPPRADGIYVAGETTVQRFQRGLGVDLHLMMFGDSTGTGYGCCSAEEVPGALIARALAERTGKRVRLSTKAIVGATSKGLAGQVDAMFVAGPPPDAAVIMIGANDVTTLNGIAGAAQRLHAAVRRLRCSGAVVVVGTCPDFSVISVIPQPLRWVAHTRARQLARAQTQAVKAAGGIAVPFADLRTPAFRNSPGLLFAQDQYHPSAAGYALAASQLIPALCAALDEADSRVMARAD